MAKSKATIRDILSYPSPEDEEDRRVEVHYSMLANIGRIRDNATRLLQDPALIEGEKRGDATLTYVAKDCRRALACIKIMEEAGEKILTGPCTAADVADFGEAAFHLGATDQRMINRVVWDQSIRAGRQARQSRSLGPEKKHEKAQAGYREINEAVAAKLKRRGRHKTPSLTQIRKAVAKELCVSYTRVLDAARGGRK